MYIFSPHQPVVEIDISIPQVKPPVTTAPVQQGTYSLFSGTWSVPLSSADTKSKAIIILRFFSIFFLQDFRVIFN